MLGRIRALVGDAVDRLDLKGVDSVCQQVTDEDSGFGQSQLPGLKLHVIITMRAGTTVRLAFLTNNIIHDIITAARLAWRVPLQSHGGLVYNGDDVSWSRRNT